MLRYPVLLLLTPVPMLLTIQFLPLWFAGDGLPNVIEFLHPVLTTLSLALPVLLSIAAWFLGSATVLLGSQSGAETFRWTLPLKRARAQRLRLIFSLGMLGLVAVPPLLIVLLQVLIQPGDTRTGLVPSFIVWCCTAAAVLATAHLCSAGLPAKSAIRTAGMLSVSVAVSMFLTHELGDLRENLFPSIAAAVVLISIAWFVSPHVERRREV